MTKLYLSCAAAVLAAAVFVPAANAAMPATTTYTENHQTTTYHETTVTKPTYELSPLSGIYVGGFGGYGRTTEDDVAGSNPHLNGFDYGAFAGYTLDTLLDRTIGLGITGSLEGFYGWTSREKDNEGGVNYSKKHDWGFSFRPGLSFVNDYTFGLKPYAILGYRRAEYKAAAVGGSNKTNFNGYELGIGTELVAYQNYGVRLDYSHVFYDKNDGIDPSENDIRLGVAYHF